MQVRGFVLAHSIGRIHGENLVNYGVLPLMFVEPGDLGRGFFLH
jgi:aconitase A